MIKKNINSIISNLTSQISETESWWLIEKLIKKSKAELISKENILLSTQQQKTIDQWIKQIIKDKKPLQYILGSVFFCNLEILVEPPILIPRPETEEWCSWLIFQFKKLNNPKIKILDLCTGSGCIALSLAHAFPQAHVIGTDINPQAISLSNKNKIHNNIKNVEFIRSDLYKELQTQKNSFDLIVSNPPYISKQEYENLDDNIKLWEDKIALLSMNKGLFTLKTIVQNAHKFLKTNQNLKNLNLPQIVLEFGIHQENYIKQILEQAYFSNIQIHKDIANIPRWATANLTNF